MTSGFPQRGTKYWSTQLRSSSQDIWVQNLCWLSMWNKTLLCVTKSRKWSNLWTRLRISRTTDSVSSELESCELVKDIWKLNFAWMGLPLVQSTFYLRVVNILQLFRLGNHISLSYPSWCQKARGATESCPKHPQGPTSRCPKHKFHIRSFSKAQSLCILT